MAVPFRSLSFAPRLLLSVFVCVSVFAVSPAQASGPATADNLEAAWERHQALEASSPFHGLEWRSVGPVRQGGRVVDIEAVPGAPYSFYVAYASGGLWKTTNNGGSFEPVFDHQPTMVMGDVAVDPSNPDTVWVGTGENNSSRSSYGGMGMFRSTDGGATWEPRGLSDSDRIGRIVVDPRDGRRVWVAVLGRLYTPGGARGVFRTNDAGETWTQVLAGDDTTGFIDLTQDPSNSDVLYAAAWERTRRPWDFVEGGNGSGIWKTTDGGETWARLEGGLPQGAHVGRIGLAVAASQPRTLYASIDNQEELPESEWDLGDGPLTTNRLRMMTRDTFLSQDPSEIERFIRGNDLDTALDAKELVAMIESEELTMDELRAELADANANLFNTNVRGLEIWRSDDAGGTWHRTHEEPLRNVVYTYGYYFGQIAVAPDDPDRVFAIGVPLIASSDGGKTFESAQGDDVHVDYHPVWIDPDFPERVMVGNDGGVDVSYDDGGTWFGLDGQPVGQFYAITLDNADPYNIYGGLQDNGSLKGSSQTDWQGGDRWQFIGGGDGMYVQVDPRNDETTYAGFQFGFYRRSGDGPPATVRPRDKLKEPALRYNWMTPIQLSPHSPDIVYFGANQLMRSLDRGETWTAISSDLTRSPNRGDVPFGTISTLAESPLDFGLIWVGTDDGLVHVTEDGGVSWRDVSAGLPSERWISRVEPSAVDRAVAYVSLNGYRNDDPTAYLYRTEDLGKTWVSISKGLPAEPVNVVREDPVVADILYVGTDRGVYVSLDRGSEWHALQAALPNVPVHDLAVHKRERELVAGTHGRSIWIADVLPVQELAAVRDTPVYVFPVAKKTYDRRWSSRPSPWFHRPEDDPEVRIPYWSSTDGTAVLTVLDGDERPLRTVEMTARTGVNAFVWDLMLDEQMALAAEQAASLPVEDEKKKRKSRKKKRKAQAEDSEEEVKKGTLADTPWAEAVRLGRRMFATPGTYTLRFTMGENSSETSFVIEPPEAPKPRMKKEPAIRGREDEDE